MTVIKKDKNTLKIKFDKTKKKMGIVIKKEILIPFDYKDICFVSTKQGGDLTEHFMFKKRTYWGLIDVKNNVLIPDIYTKIICDERLKERGCFIVKSKKNHYGLYKIGEGEIIPAIYNTYNITSGDLSAPEIEKIYSTYIKFSGYVQKNKNHIIHNGEQVRKFDCVEYFDDMVILKDNDSIFFKNHYSNDLKTKYLYFTVTAEKNKFFAQIDNGTMCLIDKEENILLDTKGTIVVSTILDHIWLVGTYGCWGAIDIQKNDFAIPAIYQWIRPLKNGHAILIQYDTSKYSWHLAALGDSTCGVVDFNGRIIIPMTPETHINYVSLYTITTYKDGKELGSHQVNLDGSKVDKEQKEKIFKKQKIQKKRLNYIKKMKQRKAYKKLFLHSISTKETDLYSTKEKEEYNEKQIIGFDFTGDSIYSSSHPSLRFSRSHFNGNNNSLIYKKLIFLKRLYLASRIVYLYNKVAILKSKR